MQHSWVGINSTYCVVTPSPCSSWRLHLGNTVDVLCDLLAQAKASPGKCLPRWVQLSDSCPCIDWHVRSEIDGVSEPCVRSLWANYFIGGIQQYLVTTTISVEQTPGREALWLPLLRLWSVGGRHELEKECGKHIKCRVPSSLVLENFAPSCSHQQAPFHKMVK